MFSNSWYKINEEKVLGLLFSPECVECHVVGILIPQYFHISLPVLQRISYGLLGYFKYYKIRWCKLGSEKIQNRKQCLNSLATESQAIKLVLAQQ